MIIEMAVLQMQIHQILVNRVEIPMKMNEYIKQCTVR